MEWRVFCDFDGTIALEDVTDSILARFALDGWEEIEAEWTSGRIGSRDCMARQVDLIRASQAELNAHLDQVDIDPAFAAFVDECRASDVPLSIVSDGLDYAIHRILDRNGISGIPIVANHLVSLGDRRFRLEFPHANFACAKASGTCKCKVAEKQTAGRALSLLVGDGGSDFCAAGSVDLVFAKDSLLTYCREQAMPVVGYTNFADATLLLGTLLDEPMRLGVTAVFG